MGYNLQQRMHIGWIPPELVELRKEINKLLATGFICPAKASYEAWILFQKKTGHYIYASTTEL